MRKSKRFSALFLVLALTFSLFSPVFAADQSQMDAANTLYMLGLFSGTGTDAAGNPSFDLDRTPTRAEAVVMLVRLLGKEAEAKAGQWQTPFTDTAAYSWALPYIGYAYTNGLAQGNGTIFDGGSPTTAAQYLTFVLRALGYDSKTDFQWDKAADFASSLGLHFYTKTFTRDGIADISLRALTLAQKGNGDTLLQELVNSGAVTAPQIEAAAAIPGNENLNPAATYEDLAHFLVKYFPIKSYVSKYGKSYGAGAKSKYADDILTLLNSGLSYADYAFGTNSTVSTDTFAEWIYKLIIDSGCAPEALLPRDLSKRDAYPVALLRHLDILADDSSKDIPLYLLSKDTADKIKKIPHGELLGTVSTVSELRILKYVELEGQVYGAYHIGLPTVYKINVNGVDGLYASANLPYITSANHSSDDYDGIPVYLKYGIGDYSIASTNNPFLSGEVNALGHKGLIRFSQEEEYVNATEKEVFTTISVATKSLTSTDFPTGGVADVKGIEYVNGYLKIDDVLAYYGIKKTVTIEQQGDLEVLCFR